MLPASLPAFDAGAPLPCFPGTFAASTGQRACTPCGLGTYSDTAGESVCQSCGVNKSRPDLWTTMKQILNKGQREWVRAEGSANQSACGCDTGARPVGDGCIPCTEGFECLGMDDVRITPSYWSSPEEPTSVFRCDGVERCPGGQPGSCAPNLEGRSCAHCEQGYAWTTDRCAECTSVEKSEMLFPVLPLMLGPVVVVGIYKLFGDTYSRWSSWQNGVASVAFIALNHYQIIVLLGSSELGFPEGDVDSTFGFWTFTSDVGTLFQPACAGYGSFQSSLLYKSLTPLLVAIFFYLTFIGSQFLGKVTKKSHLCMEKYRTMNGFFGVMFTFFGAVAAMAFALFKCSPNPNGKTTLIEDRSIICGGPEWNGMAVIGVLAVLFWCCGFWAVFLYLTVMAPRRFDDTNFQMLAKFLLIKYRPDVHWWAMVVMAKGVLLNLGFLFFQRAVTQITWVMTTLVVYSALAAICRPWRHKGVSTVDMIAHLCLTLTCMVLAWFARSEDEELSRTMAKFAVVISLLVLPEAGAAVLYLLSDQVCDRYKQRKHESTQVVLEAFQRFHDYEENSQERFLEGLGHWDMWFMEKAADIIFVELVKTRLESGSSTSFRCSPHTLSEVPCESASSSVYRRNKTNSVAGDLKSLSSGSGLLQHPQPSLGSAESFADLGEESVRPMVHGNGHARHKVTEALLLSKDWNGSNVLEGESTKL